MSDHLRAAGAAERLDHPMHEELPAYATAIAIGDTPEALYPSVAAHLESCAACRATLEELLELLQPAYTGQLAPAPHYPTADLWFLEVPMQSFDTTAPVWRLDAGRLEIRFSKGLLTSLRQPSLAGATRGGRGQLLYRYTQEPGSVQDLGVSIEVYAEDAAQKYGRVRVGVDVPSRGPLDQTGNLVKLHLGDDEWEAETDETGSVDFAPIPLEELPRLRVEITPCQL